MPASLANILSELQSLAEYTGPWRTLRAEQDKLRTRLDELRERESRLDDVLVVAIVGGSGVGKSTLLNAIAGDEIAKTSPYRPCTTQPTVYHPPGAVLPFGDWACVARSALEHLAIVDTPDTDSIAEEHRERTVEVLRQCDLILLCGTAEKYLDEATWALLRPLRGERTMICVETKAGGDDAIRAHWLQHLEGQGFEIADYFRVQALRSLDRKLNATEPAPEELDFPRLENFLAQELTKERIARIKKSNASGLLGKTVRDLQAQLSPAEESLHELERLLDEGTRLLAEQCTKSAEDRLFTEGHLWHLMLGREVSLRSKGIVGGCLRILEGLRSLPTRIAGLLPRFGKSGGAEKGGAWDGERLFAGEIAALGEEAVSHFRASHSKIHLAMARAQFETPADGGNAQVFREEITAKVRAALHGPAQQAVFRRARFITSWPVALLLDLPLVAFFVYAAWKSTQSYFASGEIPPGFFQSSVIMFCILLIVELFALSLTVRGLAWNARKAAAKAFRLAFAGQVQAFPLEEEGVRRALGVIETLNRLAQEIRGA